MLGTSKPPDAHPKFGALRLPGRSSLFTPFTQDTTALPKSADLVPDQLSPLTSGRATQFPVLPTSHYHTHASHLFPPTSPDPEIDPNMQSYPFAKNSNHEPQFPHPRTPSTLYHPPSPQLPSLISLSTQAACKSQPLTGNSECEQAQILVCLIALLHSF